MSLSTAMAAFKEFLVLSIYPLNRKPRSFSFLKDNSAFKTLKYFPHPWASWCWGHRRVWVCDLEARCSPGVSPRTRQFRCCSWLHWGAAHPRVDSGWSGLPLGRSESWEGTCQMPWRMVWWRGRGFCGNKWICKMINVYHVLVWKIMTMSTSNVASWQSLLSCVFCLQ